MHDEIKVIPEFMDLFLKENSISFGFLSLSILFSPDFRAKYIVIGIIIAISGANGLNI